MAQRSECLLHLLHRASSMFTNKIVVHYAHEIIFSFRQSYSFVDNSIFIFMHDIFLSKSYRIFVCIETMCSAVCVRISRCFEFSPNPINSIKNLPWSDDTTPITSECLVSSFPLAIEGWCRCCCAPAKLADLWNVRKKTNQLAVSGTWGGRTDNKKIWLNYLLFFFVWAVCISASCHCRRRCGNMNLSILSTLCVIFPINLIHTIVGRTIDCHFPSFQGSTQAMEQFCINFPETRRSIARIRITLSPSFSTSTQRPHDNISFVFLSHSKTSKSIKFIHAFRFERNQSMMLLQSWNNGW